MGAINILSPQMANLIAAGEVVDRPGSAVKEIIENSIDAASSRIEVEIKNGGITYIRVSDDGSGIEPEDVEKAFLRHATSKIKEPSDMLGIATMGFRGEALAAISAVANVDIFTRTVVGISGVHMTCEAGQNGTPVETGCPKGTTVIIRDIFHNVPARMKFLKKDATEGAYCESAVIGAALSHPDVSFRLIKDGRESFFTSGDGSLLQVINAIFGRDVSLGLLPIKGSFPDVEIRGYISPASMTRSSRSMQYFLVNGRPVRGKILSAAIDSAYKGKVMPGRHPVCFLNIGIPYTAVDVNVHPSKLEVKFAREKDIFTAICNSVSIALDEDGGFPEISFDSRQKQAIREDNLNGFQQELIVSVTGPGHFTASEGSFSSDSLRSSQPQVKTEAKKPIYSVLNDNSALDFDESMFKINKMELVPPRKSEPETSSAASGPCDISDVSEEEVTALYQQRKADEAERLTGGVKVLGIAFNTYIIAQQDDGIWLIDKHAAHEKLIYNELIMKAGEQDMQTLLKPISVTLSAEEKQACVENLPLLEKSGFEVEDFGLSGLAVRRAPVYLDEADIPFVLSEIAERLLGGFQPGSTILEEILKSISCKAAIKGGSHSDIQELELLCEKVLTLPDVKNCPHGRPIAVFMSKYQMEKQFKRIL
ncbi:MAG: DNA mismatch repair endonuclease MutL [Clostridiaceae bacterium]|nr:DNA mismatch repair endonuclease MutL [Clostridiaceae bacterium]